MSKESSGRLHVLVLATTLPATRDDGTPQFVLDLSEGLAGAADVTIVAPRVPGGAPREHVRGVDIVRVPYFPRRWERLADGAMLPNIRQRPVLALQAPFLLLSLLLAALRVVRHQRVDVVHAHWLVPGGMLAAVLRRVTSTPYVVTGHGADVFALRGRAMGTCKAWVCDRAAAVGAASTSLAEALPPTDTPVEVIPMGVDIDDLRAEGGPPNPEFGRVLFIGRLAGKKGVPVLLRAVARVPDATLVVGGNGPDEDELAALAQELGIGDRVTFPGRLSRTEVKQQLRRATVLVVPSTVAADGDQDTTPLVMSEAMAVGVPVIASALGGLAEQIDDGENGLLVEPGSVDDLARALQWAVDHPSELEAIARTATARIEGSAIDLRSTTAAYVRLLRGAAAVTSS